VRLSDPDYSDDYYYAAFSLDKASNKSVREDRALLIAQFGIKVGRYATSIGFYEAHTLEQAQRVRQATARLLNFPLTAVLGAAEPHPDSANAIQ
jgi:hypothetical protein